MHFWLNGHFLHFSVLWFSIFFIRSTDPARFKGLSTAKYKKKENWQKWVAHWDLVLDDVGYKAKKNSTSKDFKSTVTIINCFCTFSIQKTIMHRFWVNKIFQWFFWDRCNRLRLPVPNICQPLATFQSLLCRTLWTISMQSISILKVPNWNSPTSKTLSVHYKLWCKSFMKLIPSFMFMFIYKHFSYL